MRKSECMTHIIYHRHILQTSCVYTFYKPDVHVDGGEATRKAHHTHHVSRTRYTHQLAGGVNVAIDGCAMQRTVALTRHGVHISPRPDQHLQCSLVAVGCTCVCIEREGRGRKGGREGGREGGKGGRASAREKRRERTLRVGS